ncbi:hypothetical protein Tco_1502425 [Tanacetum coccineum]
MPNSQSGASRTRKGINEKIDRQMAGTLGAHNAARNLEPLMRDEGGQEEVNRNGGNGNGGNGNGNGNGGGNGYNFEGFVPARECTYQDFLKCQPLSFNGTERVVGVLTWWNSHKRTIGIEAAYAMSWTELIKLMIEVYCPRNEIQKMETEMVPNEEDKVERFIGGLPDNIQGIVSFVTPPRHAAYGTYNPNPNLLWPRSFLSISSEGREATVSRMQVKLATLLLARKGIRKATSRFLLWRSKASDQIEELGKGPSVEVNEIAVMFRCFLMRIEAVLYHLGSVLFIREYVCRIAQWSYLLIVKLTSQA